MVAVKFDDAETFAPAGGSASQTPAPAPFGATQNSYLDSIKGGYQSTVASVGATINRATGLNGDTAASWLLPIVGLGVVGAIVAATRGKGKKGVFGKKSTGFKFK